MIYHQIRFSVRPDADPAQVEEGFGFLRRMGREIDVVQQWIVGRDIGGDHEYGALYVLADVAAYSTFMNHPLHLATDKAGIPVLSNMVSFDLTDDEDPAIGDAIADVHRKRFANNPELAALVGSMDSYDGSGAEGVS